MLKDEKNGDRKLVAVKASDKVDVWGVGPVAFILGSLKGVEFEEELWTVLQNHSSSPWTLTWSKNRLPNSSNFA